MHYYLTIQGNTVGPMTREQLMAYNVNTDTLVSRDGGPWSPLYTYPELMETYHNHMAQQQTSNPASQRTICGILAILIGTLGIQYFLVGKTIAGIITILLSVVSCGLWGIITFIQGIMMLCMTDEQFRQKYVDSTSTFPVF